MNDREKTPTTIETALNDPVTAEFAELLKLVPPATKEKILYMAMGAALCNEKAAG